MQNVAAEQLVQRLETPTCPERQVSVHVLPLRLKLPMQELQLFAKFMQVAHVELQGEATPELL